jgi:hypothetical protein
MSQYINEAFKKFRLIEDFEEFPLNPEGLDNLGSFMGQALDDESVDVYDLEAEAQEDLKKSYVGKVICDCNVCHSNIFYNKEDIVIDDDGIVNAEDECPYCMSTDGYTIIGEIKEWSPEVEDEIEDEPSDEELADEPIEIEDEEDTEVVEEGLKLDGVKSLRGTKGLKKRPEKAGVKAIRGIGDSKISGTTLEEALSGDSYVCDFIGWGDRRFHDYLAGVDGGDITFTEDPNKAMKFNSFDEAADFCVENVLADGEMELPAIVTVAEAFEDLGINESCGKKNKKKIKDGTTLEEDVESDNALRDRAHLDDNAILYRIIRDRRTKKVRNNPAFIDDVYKYIKKFEKSSRYSSFDDIVSAAIEEALSDFVIGGAPGIISEAIEDVTINTEDETMTMTTKEDGGVVVETSPKQSDEFYDDFDIPADDEDIEIGDDVEAGDEVIAPISDETEDEIMGNSGEDEFSDEEIFAEEPTEEESTEEEPEEDIEVSDFDEETFDGLGESYLRRCYDNVNGYKTTQVRANNNTLIVEGVISFKSGSKKKTNFVFESKDAKNGKYIFEGYNAQINNGRPAFRLNCSIKNKEIIPTSFKYNYTSKNALNESVKLSGTVKAKRK